MTKRICSECGKEYDDKYYINNEIGFKETLIHHAKQHEDDDLILKYFLYESQSKVEVDHNDEPFTKRKDDLKVESE